MFTKNASAMAVFDEPTNKSAKEERKLSELVAEEGRKLLEVEDDRGMF